MMVLADWYLLAAVEIKGLTEALMAQLRIV